MTMCEKFERLLFQCVINYPYYISLARKVEDETVVMHKVGHNATHEFWLGMRHDERMVYLSVCEDCDGSMSDEHLRVFPKGEYPSYIGHW